MLSGLQPQTDFRSTRKNTPLINYRELTSLASFEIANVWTDENVHYW